MKTSYNTISLIKNLEGLKLTPYLDSANIWTIGYGSTQNIQANSSPISMKIAENLLQEHLKHVEDVILNLVSVPLSQNQFDSLVSLIYNVGEKNFADSTLLKKLNQKDYYGAALEFPKWKYAKGKVLNGLVKRRKIEKNLFLSP